MLLRVLYIDLSGIGVLDNISSYKHGYYTRKELKADYGVAFMFAPGIVHLIIEFADIYEEAIIDRIYEQKLPIQLCNKELFKNIVKSVIDDTYDEEKAEKELKKAYYKLVDSI